VPDDQRVKPFAFERTHQLRVADSSDVPIGMEHDRRRDNRASQEATPDCVATSDPREPNAAQRDFQRAHGRDAHTDLERRTRVV